MRYVIGIRLFLRLRLVRSTRAVRLLIPIIVVDVIARPYRGLRAVLQSQFSQDRFHVDLNS